MLITCHAPVENWYAMIGSFLALADAILDQACRTPIGNLTGESLRNTHHTEADAWPAPPPEPPSINDPNSSTEVSNVTVDLWTGLSERTHSQLCQALPARNTIRLILYDYVIVFMSRLSIIE